MHYQSTVSQVPNVTVCNSSAPEHSSPGPALPAFPALSPWALSAAAVLLRAAISSSVREEELVSESGRPHLTEAFKIKARTLDLSPYSMGDFGGI